MRTMNKNEKEILFRSLKGIERCLVELLEKIPRIIEEKCQEAQKSKPERDPIMDIF